MVKGTDAKDDQSESSECFENQDRKGRKEDLASKAQGGEMDKFESTFKDQTTSSAGGGRDR